MHKQRLAVIVAVAVAVAFAARIKLPRVMMLLVVNVLLRKQTNEELASLSTIYFLFIAIRLCNNALRVQDCAPQAKYVLSFHPFAMLPNAFFCSMRVEHLPFSVLFPINPATCKLTSIRP